MPTGHVTHQAPINRGKCYQPTIVRQDNLRNLPLFCGTAPAASVHDLDTFEKIAQGESRGNRYTIFELKATASAPSRPVADPTPGRLRAAAVDSISGRSLRRFLPVNWPGCFGGRTSFSLASRATGSRVCWSSGDGRRRDGQARRAWMPPSLELPAGATRPAPLWAGA